MGHIERNYHHKDVKAQDEPAEITIKSFQCIKKREKQQIHTSFEKKIAIVIR